MDVDDSGKDAEKRKIKVKAVEIRGKTAGLLQSVAGMSQEILHCLMLPKRRVANGTFR